MIEDSYENIANSVSFVEAAQCLLLIPAPSDRDIYRAFRALAAHARHGCKEYLSIEGGVVLTAGLCAPDTPPTLERLLNADCEMIDRLELELDGLRWSYVRSGGHAPFRESFFDEVHLKQVGELTLSPDELRALLECALQELPIVSHSGETDLAHLISEISQGSRGSFVTVTHGTRESTSL
jgi:hypothetical protein